MRVFYGKHSWSGKVNFVDDNNVALGYDNENDCCAHGGWFISDKAADNLQDSFQEGEMELAGFNFDTKYYVEKNLDKNPESTPEAVQFRLTNGTDEKFLTLYNFHNGYYSRGFEFKCGDKLLKKGGI